MAPEANSKSTFELGGLLAHGIKHLNWHPDQNKDSRKYDHSIATFSGIETVEQETAKFFGEQVETDLRGAVNQIYREAFESFKKDYKTDFRPPELVLDDNVLEGVKGLFGEQAGYFIDHENDQIVLNTEIVGDLHPSLLEQDLQYMMKRYHDLSLEEKVRRDVIPYVHSLKPESEVNVQEVVFAELDDAEGCYNPKHEVMKVDHSRLQDFDPVTGQFRSGFEGLSGAVILLHEEVHDRDFSINPDSRNYLNNLTTTDRNDPRNAVLEAPTTFEVFMAGWDVRDKALQAFENPLENLEFFRNYPAEGGEDADKDELIYPYNMGLFTALTVHNAMMQERGVHEGTRVTRDILYGNDWDLQQMQGILETTFERREVPNVPKHRRRAAEAVENDRHNEEASEIIKMLEESEEDAAIRGNELIREYRQNSNTKNSKAVEELHEAISDTERQFLS